MSQPQLAYGGTTVTLSYPSASGDNVRTYDERRIDQRTAAGYLRTQVLSRSWRYRLSFVHDPVATFDAVVALWEACVAAGAYPTFTWSGGLWASAEAGVSVSLVVSDDTPSGPLFGYADWTLELSEVTPR